MKISKRIKIDDANDVVTIDGRQISGECLRMFTTTHPVGQWVRLECPPDSSVIIVHMRRDSQFQYSAGMADARPTDISRELREFAGNSGYSHNDYADVMRRAADECERFYGGMVAWKRRAEEVDARPATRAQRGDQAGWVDQFGNLYPLAAYSVDGKPNYHDVHKRGWEAVYRGAVASEGNGKVTPSSKQTARSKYLRDLVSSGCDVNLAKSDVIAAAEEIERYYGGMMAWKRTAEVADRIAINDLCALLPGSYYMDPPDGGSVSVMEQLRRMAEDAAKFRAMPVAAPATLSQGGGGGMKMDDASVAKVQGAKNAMVNALIASGLNYGVCGAISHHVQRVVDGLKDTAPATRSTS